MNWLQHTGDKRGAPEDRNVVHECAPLSDGRVASGNDKPKWQEREQNALLVDLQSGSEIGDGAKRDDE